MRGGRSLGAFRATALRGAAVTLAVGSTAVALVFALAGELGPVDLAAIGVTVVMHVVIAALVGRRTEPTSWPVHLYLLVLVAVIVAGAVGTASMRDSEAFWFLLVPVGLGGLVLSARPQVVLVAVACGGFVAAGLLGAGLTLPLTAVRLVALAGVGAMLWTLTDRLGTALDEASAAGTLATERAARMASVARSARRIEQLEAGAVLEAVLHATAELGWDGAALVLRGREDEPAVVRSQGLDLPEDPLEGAVARAFATGAPQDATARDAAMLRSGMRHGVVTPVRIDGTILGALVVGTRSDRATEATDREALGLIAGQAGRALAIAGRMEHQRTRVSDLEARGRERDDLQSTLAHELRTPVTVIVGLAQTLRLRQQMLPEDARGLLIERLEANARSLEGICSSMLDLARLDRGALEIEEERVDLARTVALTVERLGPLLSEHQVDVRTTGPSQVSGDPRLLERVVENLLTNAVRHTPAGTRIVAAVEEVGGRTTVRVEDDGPGLTADEVRALGERFRRGGDPASRDRAGAGLGMALVVTVLRLHGTELAVASLPGEGATFAFSLPTLHELEVELDLSSLDPDGRHIRAALR